MDLDRVLGLGRPITLALYISFIFTSFIFFSNHLNWLY